MIEDEFLPDLSLENPVRRCTRSRGTSRCRQTVRLARRPAHPAARSCSGSTSSTRRSTWSARTTRRRTREVLQRWEAVLAGARGRTRSRCTASWTGWRSTGCLTAYRERDGLEWTRPASSRRSTCSTTTCAVERGLYYRLDAGGQGRAARDGRGGRARGHGAAGGHPRVLPRAGASRGTRTPSRPRRGTR